MKRTNLKIRLVVRILVVIVVGFMFCNFNGGAITQVFGVQPPPQSLIEDEVENPKLLPRGKQMVPAGLQRKELWGLELEGRPRKKSDIVKALRHYLKAHPEWLQGLSLGQLKLFYTSTIPATETRPAMTYVQFIQQVQGLEIQGSYVHFSVKILDDKSLIMSARSQVYPDLRLQAATPQDIKSMRKQAIQDLGLSPGRTTLKKEKQLVRFINERWRRVYEFRFAESVFKGVVDSDTGESWIEDERIYETIQGRVQGRGILFDPIATGEDLDTFNLKDLEVETEGGNTAYTDSEGNFEFPTETSPTIVTAGLEGYWAKVNSETSPNLNFMDAAFLGIPLDILFNPTDAEELPTAQVNGYYHTITIHDWVQTRLPTLLEGIDIQLPVNVNIDDSCNAYYTLTTPSINFFTSGGSCINTAFDTVIYHEYGHFADDMAGGIPWTTPGVGLSEGWGDILGSYATGQPILGEGFLGPDTYIRTADNDYQYPIDGMDEVHALGQAWSGFAWHLRENLITSLGETIGIEVTENLIIPVLLANSTDIPGAVLDTLLLDDDDGELSNGTPYQNEIMDAARQHSIPLGDASSVQIASPTDSSNLSQEDGFVAITGTATGMDSLGLTFQQYQLFYGRGTSPIEWIPIDQPVFTPVIDGTLGTWSISELTDGAFSLRLVVTMTGGIAFEDYIKVLILRNPHVQITTDPKSQEGVDIDGDLIVWHDARNIPNEGPYSKNCYSLGRNCDIYLFDLSTNTERQITFDPGHQWNPSISGNRIIWSDYRNGNWDIYLYDLVTDTEYPIITDPAEQYSPIIYRDLIVWRDYRYGNWDVFLYDLTTNTEWQITNDPAYQSPTDIEGNKIVWSDYRDGNSNIYLCDYNSETGACPEQQITSGTGIYHHAADISGDKMVWYDNRNGNWDIFLYNLSSGTERQITTDSKDKKFPRIDGNRIVWNSMYFSMPDDVYYYDLINDTETQLTISPTLQGLPAISGNRIVWEDLRNANGNNVDNLDIYLYEITPSSPCDSFGDVDMNGVITKNDAQLTLKYDAEEITLTEEQKRRADVNGDGDVDSVDALFILQYSQGLRDAFPVCTLDTDNDGIPDYLDEDDDNDGFTDDIEIYIGTDPLRACGDNAWPPDFNNDRFVTIVDVLGYKGKIGARLGDTNYTPRYDLNADGFITIGDVLLMKPYIGKSCE